MKRKYQLSLRKKRISTQTMTYIHTYIHTYKKRVILIIGVHEYDKIKILKADHIICLTLWKNTNMFFYSNSFYFVLYIILRYKLDSHDDLSAKANQSLVKIFEGYSVIINLILMPIPCISLVNVEYNCLMWLWFISSDIINKLNYKYVLVVITIIIVFYFS